MDGNPIPSCSYVMADDLRCYCSGAWRTCIYNVLYLLMHARRPEIDAALAAAKKRNRTAEVRRIWGFCS